MAGRFPRLVGWAQGAVNYRLDLDSGRRWASGRRTPSREKPQDTLRVLTTDKTPPKRQRFRMGVVNVQVTPRDLTFSRRGNLRPTRRFRR